MTLQQWFGLIWAVIVGTGLLVEVVAIVLALRGHKDLTLSERIRLWFRVRDPRPTAVTWVLRVSLFVFLVWLVPHWSF